jgi:hypothetical protein
MQPKPSIRGVCRRSNARKRANAPREMKASPAEVLDMAAFFIYQSQIESALRELAGG